MKAGKTSICIMALTMIAGMLAGCGGKAKETTAAKSKSKDEITELTFYNADGQEDTWSDPVAEELTKKTGVKLKTDYPVASDDKKVALMIAEQNYPDLIYAKGDASSLIDAGALIDMSDLIDKYGPNIKKMYGDEFDKLKYTQDDPSIYQLSSYKIGGTVFESTGTAQIQWAALKENDYKLPESLEDYEKMIKDYLAAHPKTDDGMDTIGLTLSAADWHWMITLGNPAGFIADGAPDNGQWLIDDDYNAMYKFRSEKEREYFKWLNRMYNEGVLDPEFATQTHEDYIAKIASGRVVALTDAGWDYSDGEKVLKADGKFDKTYAPLPLTIDKDTKCSALMYQGLTTGWGVAITTACEDPVAAIKYIDYICSDEGQALVNWGIKDVNYFIDESGERYRTDEEIEKSKTDKDYGKNTGVGFHAYPLPVYGAGVTDNTGSTYTCDSKETVIKEYNEEEKAACEAWGVDLLIDVFPQADEFDVPKYSPVWAYTKPAEFDDIGNKLDEIAWPKLISCVIGKEENFDKTYDEMLKELEDAGMSKTEKILTDIVKEKVKLVES